MSCRWDWEQLEWWSHGAKSLHSGSHDPLGSTLFIYKYIYICICIYTRVQPYPDPPANPVENVRTIVYASIFIIIKLELNQEYVLEGETPDSIFISFESKLDKEYALEKEGGPQRGFLSILNRMWIWNTYWMRREAPDMISVNLQ